MTAKLGLRWMLAREHLLRTWQVYLPLWIAMRLPRWLRYWVTLDSIAKATTGKYGSTVVPELRAMDVLDRI